MIRDRHDDRSVTTLVTDIEPRTPGSRSWGVPWSSELAPGVQQSSR